MTTVGLSLGLGPLMTVTIAFFLAEVVDNTMLTTVTIATQHNDFVGVHHWRDVQTIPFSHF